MTRRLQQMTNTEARGRVAQASVGAALVGAASAAMPLRAFCSRLSQGIHLRIKPHLQLAVLVSLMAGAGSIATAADAPAAPSGTAAAGKTQALDKLTKLNISLGKSSLVSLEAPISRVAVGNPAIADVKIINVKQVYILGTGIGSTNIMLWDKAGNVLVAFDVHVNLNVDQLNDEVRKLIKTGDVRVRAVGDKVVLEGRVPDPESSARVVEIVEAFGHKNIVNLLAVDTVPQAGPGKAAPAMEQIEMIRGTDITTKQFKQVPQE